jgi:hypothetical protein
MCIQARTFTNDDCDEDDERQFLSCTDVLAAPTSSARVIYPSVAVVITVTSSTTDTLRRITNLAEPVRPFSISLLGLTRFAVPANWYKTRLEDEHDKEGRASACA